MQAKHGHEQSRVSRGGLVRKAGELQRASLLFVFYVESTVTWPRPCTQLQTNMAAVGTSSTDFLFGEDFDSIFDALDEDEEFEDYLEAVVEEVSV